MLDVCATLDFRKLYVKVSRYKTAGRRSKGGKSADIILRSVLQVDYYIVRQLSNTADFECFVGGQRRCLPNHGGQPFRLLLSAGYRIPLIMRDCASLGLILSPPFTIFLWSCMDRGKTCFLPRLHFGLQKAFLVVMPLLFRSTVWRGHCLRCITTDRSYALPRSYLSRCSYMHSSRS